MRAAVTGANGFLGWHLRVRLLATRDVEAVVITRDHFADPRQLAAALDGVDTIVHLAGVNRAGSDEAVEQGNLAIARALSAAITKAGRPLHLVYANSIQSDLDNAYGRGKRRAHAALSRAVTGAAGTVANVVLPNVFGEHGRPHYNSFVATFCHEVAQGRQPEVTVDRRVSLLHAQAAADSLIRAADRRETHRLEPEGEPHSVCEVLELVNGFHQDYQQGQIPGLTCRFVTDLFNTYRSYVPLERFPVHPIVSTDSRGELFEALRSHGGTGQVFLSRTRPGMTRGNHFHLSKIERFLVIEGTAEIGLRRVLYDDVVRFHVKGDESAYVDMPTMWVHSITNIGDQDLVTLFWADQLFDPGSPDTYPGSVEPVGTLPS
ncbi:MAG: polysaccharide biosynthesis C-terminal domain-containing protein [Myxococcaceae bacterium]